ncbi:MAG: formylglycine-generating enzyme family protein [Blastochloris sp.]|nr:formylglycine-generating enzyme family protein [Blastochloris sp.]
MAVPTSPRNPLISPSLLQLSLQNATFDSRLLAKIINVTATVIKHQQTRGIPYQPLRSSHITLSPQGVIKYVNTALPATESIPEESEQLGILAQIIREFINPNETLNPSLTQLLYDLENSQVDIDSVITRANAIDIELAPVKFTPQRQEAIVAQEQVQKARKSFWIATISGIVVFAVFITWFVFYILDSYVIVSPGRDFRRQIEIPAGQVVLSNNRALPVQAFYIDEHEVTIGQYTKFLKDMEGKDPKPFLPPNFKDDKKDFIPANWEQIQRVITKRQDFEGGLLDNDCPIMNIDYADAYAYAKWAGKRLPTELEWMRAAGGDENLPYPWGRDADDRKANTGSDKNTTSTQNIAGSIDGYRGLNPVDAKNSDLSPFGVVGMGGNVTEWVELSPELGPVRADFVPFRGANHGSERLLPNQNQARTGGPKVTRNPFLGFRCASDSPVKSSPSSP